MRDRQIFETIRLKNGITVHHYPTDQPFAFFNVKIPIGNVHNTGDILPGTAHFFEHLALLRSEQYPERSAFPRWVGLHGGTFNAATNIFDTDYTMAIPAERTTEAWNGFYSHIFEPVILQEDLERERAIVSNERKQRRWYPGMTELSHYLWALWIHAEGVSKRQLFGDDEDLAKLSTEALLDFHGHYFTPDIHVLVGGTLQVEQIISSLSVLNLATHKHAETYTPFNWERKEYHECTFSDIDMPIYFTGAYYALPPYAERVALRFLLEFLTNIHHGPLYQWLRDEKGWAYSVSYDAITSGKDEALMLEIPLHDISQVTAVRKEIDERIQGAISNESLLAAEVKRQLGAEVFDFQTLENLVEEAGYDISYYGRVVSETEYREYKKRCANASYLHLIYEKYLSPSLRGEFCALPQ
ncbi:MAG: insulinase family protein [Candidatus Paceibacterota bacterium]